MAKKKSKIVSNRGFATTSAPSKKAETPVASAVAEETSEPTTTPPQEEPQEQPQEQEQPTENTTLEDEISTLVTKYASLNEHKAQAALERLNKDDPQWQQLSEERIKKFRLTAELEKTLLQVVKLRQGDTFDAFNQPLSNGAIEYDKQKIIAQFDVLYRTLLRIGFSVEDISASFEATVSKSIEDHLDWLCVNVPYERMPIGFYDKYFNDEEDDQLILLHNQSNKSEQLETPVLNQEPLVVLKPKTKTEDNEDSGDMRSRILQAAQQYTEEEEDVHEQYVKTKLKLLEIEKMVPSNNSANKKTNGGKKNKKKTTDDEEIPAIVLTDEELVKARKNIKNLKDRLASLEADWEFDKRKAEEMCTKELQNITDQKRKQQAEARALSKKKQQEEKDQQADVPVDEEQEEDDEEGGLFGGLMMDEEEEAAAMTSAPTTSTCIQWNIVDLSVAKAYAGKYPKDTLLYYSNKQKLGKLSFNSSNIGSGIWRSSLKITKEGYSTIPLRFELPTDLGTSNRHDAEQLVAAYALFEIDYNSSVYKVWPNSYKDIWVGWYTEKKAKEDAPRIEADKKRLAFLVDLVEKSFNRTHSRRNSFNRKNINAVSSEKAVMKSKDKVLKQQKMFSKVKDNFKRRLDSKDYLDMKDKRKDLPITAYREEILQLINNNQVLIISGETGCGKSTQVPQFLAEDLLIGSHQGGSVVCTQPRRISAMSIANRVSSEMGDRPRSTGSSDAMVGYQIRLESKMSAENVLLFCTTGILLRRLESDEFLAGVTHVVVDEVHERTIESDFLLVVLRKLCTIRTDLKIILMSATVEASRFSEYFGNCPVVSVPGRTYPVHVQYLEDVLEDTGYVLEEDSPYAVKRARVKTEYGNINVSGQSGSSKRVHYEMFEEDSDDEDPYDPTRIESKLTIASSMNIDDDDDDKNIGRKYSRQTRKMIKRLDDKKINYDLILELLDHICTKKTEISHEEFEFTVPETGAILVFLPGMNEIRKLYDLVAGHHVFGDPKKFLLIALHSALSSEHQEKAFDVPPAGIRKIVFSTNIAETGVTISDVTIVIDTGMAKVVSYDDKKRVTRLLQKYIAKANARQRRGRAGRVQEGVCFHLFTQQKYEEMANYETPEILRLPLEELCLRIKVCGLGSIREVLGDALDPPTEKMINNAILSLQEVQALSADGNETLTPLGMHLSNLPVDVHIGKMILFGALFRCLDPILTIAAALSFKSPFIRPFGKEDEADAARARFHVNNSDFLTIYKAYDIWRETLVDLRDNQKSSASNLMRKMRKFCKDNFLSEQNLEMIEEMKRQYLGLLVSIGFVKTKVEDHRYDMKRSGIQLCQIPDAYNEHAYSIPVINAALTAGLYPKIAEYLRQSKQIINKKMELQIHPSSLLFHREHSFISDFLIYNTVVMNNANGQMKDKVYMWETSSVDPVAVILLSTGLDIKYNQRRMVIDNWVYFDCFARTAVLLKFLRQELNNWLTEKMVRPDLDLSRHNEEVMDALVMTLEANAV